MFDIGFLELVLLSVVSLVVLGPERLPGAIRTVSLWIGRLRRSFNTIKQDIEKEIGADEIRRQLRNEAIMEKFKNTKSQVTNTIESVKKEADTIRKNVELEAEAASMTSKPAAKADPAIAPTSGDEQPDLAANAAPGPAGSPINSPAGGPTQTPPRTPLNSPPESSVKSPATASTTTAAPGSATVSAKPSTTPGSDKAAAPVTETLATETEKS